MPLAMARRALDDRIVRRDSRLLARLRDTVDVRSQGDHRLSAPPARHPRGGDTGDPALEREPVALEDGTQVLGGLDLLHSELAEREDLVDHLLSERRMGVDGASKLCLTPVDPVESG